MVIYPPLVCTSVMRQSLPSQKTIYNWRRPSRSKRLHFYLFFTATWLLNNLPSPPYLHVAIIAQSPALPSRCYYCTITTPTFTLLLLHNHHPLPSRCYYCAITSPYVTSCKSDCHTWNPDEPAKWKCQINIHHHIHHHSSIYFWNTTCSVHLTIYGGDALL